MAKVRVQLLIWLLVALFGCAAVLALTRSAAELIAYFAAGADPAAIFNQIPDVPLDNRPLVTWLPDGEDTGRVVEPVTRDAIEADYLRSWLQWNVSFWRGEASNMGSYFSGPALLAVNQALRDVHEQGWRISQTTVEHNLQLHFYSADGSIVSFTDSDLWLIQILHDESGRVVLTSERRVTYDVVMFLEDGNWHIRQMIKVDEKPLEETPPLAAMPPPGFVIRDGSVLRIEGEPLAIRGINYYPQETPWQHFWEQYSAATTAADLAVMQQLGLNSVRIFVPFESFGGAQLDPNMIANLEDFLQQAGAARLRVIVTLFDFRLDYKLLDWPGANQHLAGLLTHFRDNPAILAWDIKNEPDLDFEGAGQELVLAWLAHVLRQARRYDPNHLITIGWSTPAQAHHLAAEVDFVSFHYYGPAAELSDQYTRLTGRVPSRPIVLTEFGLPTWNPIFYPHGHTETEQAAYYADLLSVVRDRDLAGYLAWTLYDYDNIPAGVAGRYPWQTGPQEEMGMIDRKGEFKAAAHLLSENAALEAVPAPLPGARFLKPFWLAILSGMVLLLIGMRGFVASRL